MEDQLKELFESLSSDVLTEDVKLKLATIFEASVNEAVKAKETELEEASEKEMSEFKESLVESIDDYLDYFAEQFVSQNEVMVEDFTKVKVAEKVLENFKEMCNAFNISLSEETVSFEEEIQEAKESENKAINDLVEARKEIELLKKTAIITEASKQLETEVQVEDLVEKVKSLDFDDVFESKVQIFVEQILGTKKEEEHKKLEEFVEPKDETKKPSDKMSKYLNYLK